MLTVLSLYFSENPAVLPEEK